MSAPPHSSSHGSFLLGVRALHNCNNYHRPTCMAQYHGTSHISDIFALVDFGETVEHYFDADFHSHYYWDDSGYHSHEKNPPDEPDYRPKLSLKKRSQKPYQDYSFASPQMVPCIAILESYDQEFPPLQTSADDARVTRRPYVAPQGVTPHGYQAITPQEEVLKWHTDNALNQNKALRRIDHRLGTLEEKVDETSAKMNHLQAHIKELKDRLATQAI
ncbi:hypothetical protein PIB30_016124 [Stylosanthes scabra]|uniref:Uncharacterized protein n=1 Tax=Stylosanthes scabra TaxID=79078 RepID=A0ABU6R7I1_9FABA|nr:hypothetical protein [Stylosanthes scabra]